jgi:TonB family protein
MTRKKVTLKRIAAVTVLVITMSLAGESLPAQETRKVIANPTPTYPEVASRLHLAGVVKVQVTIAADGKIKEVKVIGGHPVLVDAVQEALKNWKYAPGSSETTALLVFNFHE